ncbi:hypothetical protein ACEU6E_07020 [Halorutilales archaeon Cl-col2-1]
MDMKARKKRVARGSISLFLVILVVFTVLPIASAEMDISSQTEYSGGEEESNQVIETEVTISPVGNRITNATVEVDQTSKSFVDFNTFSVSVDPAGVEGRVDSLGNGEFQISELRTGEQVTLSYEAYPRSIKSRSVPVSTVDVQYVQRGQDLSEGATIEANLSSSPWFRLQETQEDLNDVRSNSTNSKWIFIGGAVLGVIGLLLAVAAALKCREGINGRGGI